MRCSTRSASRPIEVRTPDDLSGVDALFLPGGESTTMTKLSTRRVCASRSWSASRAGTARASAPAPGSILLAADVLDGRADQEPLGAARRARVRRNAYGRQRESFEALLEVDGLAGGAFPGVFIRAPVVEAVGRRG